MNKASFVAAAETLAFSIALCCCGCCGCCAVVASAVDAGLAPVILSISACNALVGTAAADSFADGVAALLIAGLFAVELVAVITPVASCGLSLDTAAGVEVVAMVWV